MQDPNQSDDSTLPRPELNPLLNPILASHMGRWAEVYFTNPPEKREDAVLELLRELESNPVGSSSTFPAVAETVLEEVVRIADARSPRQEQEEVVRITDASPPPQAVKASSVCRLCGQLNPSEQLFCGMCGARLSMGTPTDGEALHPRESAPSAFSHLPEVVSPTIRQIIEESSDPYSSPPVPSLGPARREPAVPRAEKKLGAVQVQPPPASNRRPLYFGAGVVALLLALLVYTGWHTSVAPAVGSSGATTEGLKPSSSQPAQPVPPPSQPAHSAIQNTPTHPKKLPAADRQPASMKTPATASSATPSLEGGTEELARAQKYLNGAQGENHDSSEAAKWLWKAVSKQNMTGTLLLSDLYLRGDGVPRSCDQARLLLDAAARKGNAEAGQRLRNLHAFGCQ